MKMPLEIRELVIRTAVNNESLQSSQNLMNSHSGELSEASQAAIIAACIEQVLFILQSRAER